MPLYALVVLSRLRVRPKQRRAHRVAARRALKRSALRGGARAEGLPVAVGRLISPLRQRRREL